jgi:hypothetical protein
MKLLIVGSAAYDTVETATGRGEEALGGAAVYSSVAASFYCPPGMVAVTVLVAVLMPLTVPSPELVLWPPGAPEISQVAWQKTSQAINSTPVSRRMITAAIRKIMNREDTTKY